MKGDISPLLVSMLLGCHGWIAAGCRGKKGGWVRVADDRRERGVEGGV